MTDRVLEASKELKAIIAAAETAGRGLMRRFAARERLVVERKGPQDFVSEADRESENTLRSRLLRAFPRHGFVTEESAPTAATASSRFIVDPLDGTTNFLHGIPHFAISIAYWDERGPVAGVVLDPCRDEAFFAERGAGAFLQTPGGERKMTGSRHDVLTDAVIHTGIPHRGRKGGEQFLEQLSRVMAQVVGVRRLGAAALDFAYVAAGRGDGFFELGLQPWDMAAGLLLVREAGGVVTDFSGGDDMMATTEIVAAMPKLHAELLACMRP